MTAPLCHISTASRAVVTVTMNAFAAIALVAVAASYVSAQPTPTAASQPRDGVIAGGSVGVGSLTVSEFQEDGHGAFAFAAHFGGMLSPRLALLVEFYGSAYTDEESSIDVSQTNVVVGAQYWIAPKVWLKGGLGRATFGLRFEGESGRDSIKGTALLGAVGYELMRRGRWTLEGQLRLGFGSYSNDNQDGETSAVSAQLGVAWF